MAVLDYLWIALATVGGTMVAIRALAKWLGDVVAGRIERREQAALDREAEFNRHALSLEKSSYEQHLGFILDYYALFYRHYRRCQITARAEALEMPGKKAVATKDTFLAEIDSFKAEWAAVEGRMRLLLPDDLLAINEEAVAKFNEFGKAIKEFTPAEGLPRRKELLFREIDSIKRRMEAGLRSFLRTENLITQRTED